MMVTQMVTGVEGESGEVDYKRADGRSRTADLLITNQGHSFSSPFEGNKKTIKYPPFHPHNQPFTQKATKQIRIVKSSKNHSFLT